MNKQFYISNAQNGSWDLKSLNKKYVAINFLILSENGVFLIDMKYLFMFNVRRYFIYLSEYIIRLHLEIRAVKWIPMRFLFGGNNDLL